MLGTNIRLQPFFKSKAPETGFRYFVSLFSMNTQFGHNISSTECDTGTIQKLPFAVNTTTELISNKYIGQYRHAMSIETHLPDDTTAGCTDISELNRSINYGMGSFWIVPLLHSVSDITSLSN